MKAKVFDAKFDDGEEYIMNDFDLSILKRINTSPEKS